MITKIDHIGISSLDIESHIAALDELGYSLLFHEKSAPNPPEKKSVLLRHTPRHDLALLASSTGLGIELLNHGAVAKTESPMSLVSIGVDGLACKSLGDIVICGKTFTEVALSSIPCNALVLNQSGSFSCKGVCVFVQNINKSIEFWKWFGCKIIKVDEHSAHLGFTELLSKKTWSIYLAVDAERASTQYMDGRGVNSIAFVSTSAMKDNDALKALGYATTPIYNIKVNERLLSIMFVRGPSGENVEIICPVNKNSGINCVN